jgi:hypothetical protein
MKKLITTAFVCLAFASCKKEAEVKYYQGWLPDDYYEFTIKDTAVFLKIFDTDHRDVDSVTGYANKDTIAWDINTDRRDGSYYYNGIIDKNGAIRLDDSLALKSISKKEFDSIIKEAFHPKLVDKQQAVILDDYILHIKLKGWDYHNSKGETTVLIKDKKTKKLLQTIKSKDFIFEQDNLWNFVTYEDFNFDGIKDLSFYIGHLGYYCAPAENYYLFNPQKKRFEYNAEFSSIMLYGSKSNEKDKTITNFSSGSLGTHYQNKYQIEGTKFTLIKKVFIESGSGVEVTVEELRNGRWQKKVKHYSNKEADKIDFYKDF